MDVYVRRIRERGQVENAVVWRTCGFEEASMRGPRKFVPRISVKAEPTWSRPRCTREATVARDMREGKADESAADASARLRVELDNTRGLERLVPT